MNKLGELLGEIICGCVGHLTCVDFRKVKNHDRSAQWYAAPNAMPEGQAKHSIQIFVELEAPVVSNDMVVLIS